MSDFIIALLHIEDDAIKDMVNNIAENLENFVHVCYSTSPGEGDIYG